MELKQILKLSTDIINIIIKYNDFSINSFNKNLRKNPPTYFIKSWTLNDLLMKCVREGYRGFYISRRFPTVIDQIDKNINENMINKTISGTEIFYTLNFIDPIKFHIDILLLDIFDIN